MSRPSFPFLQAISACFREMDLVGVASRTMVHCLELRPSVVVISLRSVRKKKREKDKPLGGGRVRQRAGDRGRHERDKQHVQESAKNKPDGDKIHTGLVCLHSSISSLSQRRSGRYPQQGLHARVG